MRLHRTNLVAYWPATLRLKKKKIKRISVTDWIAGRENYGASGTLIKELKGEDTASLPRNLLRMDEVAHFDNLLRVVYELIEKGSTRMRMAIPPKTNSIKHFVSERYNFTRDQKKL